MLIQLLYSVARTNEQHDFVLLTQPFMTELLLDPPDNVEAMAIDVRREERGVLGLMRYARRLRLERFDAVLDLHDVLRTKFLRSYLHLFGIPTKHLKKPRQERRRLVQNSPEKDLTPLPPMWQLYRQVFIEAGLSVPESIPPIDSCRASSDCTLSYSCIVVARCAWGWHPSPRRLPRPIPQS